MIDVEPIDFIVRLFPDGAKYGDPYNGIMLIQAIGKQGLYISGLHGTITRKQLEMLHQWAFEHGFTHYYAYRHGELLKKDIKKAP
jgi:hypothetical protein